MAIKVTPEIIEQINELYCQIGVKSQVAKIIGCSASTVSKYIIKDYKPKAERVEITFDGEPDDGTIFIKEVEAMINSAPIQPIDSEFLYEEVCRPKNDEFQDMIKLKGEL